MPHHASSCTWMTGAGCSCGAWQTDEAREFLAHATAQDDELQRLRADAARYDYLLTCDYLAAKKYLPNLDEAEWKAKLRAKHDSAISLSPTPPHAAAQPE